MSLAQEDPIHINSSKAFSVVHFGKADGVPFQNELGGGLAYKIFYNFFLFFI